MMDLAKRVHTMGQYLLARHRVRVHKIALNAGFTCPNRDGTKGRGGCTFCNNASFSPGSSRAFSDTFSGKSSGGRLFEIEEQLIAGQKVIHGITGAEKFLAYFQAYTNTYADVAELRALYQKALSHPNIIGLSVGTRPDCVPDEVLNLLAEYRQQGHEVWLELGLQSAFDDTLDKINRGHSFVDYCDAVIRARRRGIPVCTHLIVGLPGENFSRVRETLQRVLAIGADGLKLHPLHVVKSTQLAYQWKRGEYEPLTAENYIVQCADLITQTPPEIVFHRITGTSPSEVLLAPAWCARKWPIINAITNRLSTRNQCQGSAIGQPYSPRAFAYDTH